MRSESVFTPSRRRRLGAFIGLAMVASLLIPTAAMADDHDWYQPPGYNPHWAAGRGNCTGWEVRNNYNLFSGNNEANVQQLTILVSDTSGTGGVVAGGAAVQPGQTLFIFDSSDATTRTFYWRNNAGNQINAGNFQALPLTRVLGEDCAQHESWQQGDSHWPEWAAGRGSCEGWEIRNNYDAYDPATGGPSGSFTADAIRQLTIRVGDTPNGGEHATDLGPGEILFVPDASDSATRTFHWNQQSSQDVPQTGSNVPLTLTRDTGDCEYEDPSEECDPQLEECEDESEECDPQLEECEDESEECDPQLEECEDENDECEIDCEDENDECEIDCEDENDECDEQLEECVNVNENDNDDEDDNDDENVDENDDEDENDESKGPWLKGDADELKFKTTKDTKFSFDPFDYVGGNEGLELSEFDSSSAKGGKVEEGSLVYTPPAGFLGTDTFTFVMSDVNGDLEVTVVVEVVAADESLPLTGGSATPIWIGMILMAIGAGLVRYVKVREI